MRLPWVPWESGWHGFQSTHSLRSATQVTVPCSIASNLFQSTHSLRSATRGEAQRMMHDPVSIHALLAECDFRSSALSAPRSCFNPRTPCGVRQTRKPIWTTTIEFQSTHSLRSATTTARRTPPPWKVSIHALLAECDGITRSLPASVLVSIHALLAECDKCLHSIAHHLNGFNPRTPCGVRRLYYISILMKVKFQSTHSLRSATKSGLPAQFMRGVSIHALLAECDP